MDAKLPDIAIAEHLAERIAAVDAGKLPAAAREKCEETLVDVVGLCIAARNEDYVGSALAGWDEDGPCTAIGHKRGLSAAGAAFGNGTAAHGEDFDDTFEGGPVHAGAVIVPAVLAIGERYRIDGKAALEGIVGRHRADVPARPRRAEDGAQGGLSSDRGVRRDGRRRRRRQGAQARPEADGRRARRGRLDGVGHHRISRRGHLDQADARRLGGAVGNARGAVGAGGLLRAAHGVRRQRTASSMASPTPRPATSTR